MLPVGAIRFEDRFCATKKGGIEKPWPASLAKPDPSIAQGSGRKPILRFVPAAGILQSNQIAERAITTY